MVHGDWWKTAFGSNYVALYADFAEKTTPKVLRFLIQVLPPGVKVLDLGCGEGRICRGLYAMGFSVTGLDFSKEMLALAGDGPYIHGDMRNLEFNEEFDAVVSIFTSFGYFDDQLDDVEVITGVHRALRSGGVFVLDLSVPETDEEFVPIIHSNGSVSIEGRYRQYNEEQARILLESQGFTDIKVYWWYSTLPLEGEPRRMILVAKK